MGPNATRLRRSLRHQGEIVEPIWAVLSLAFCYVVAVGALLATVRVAGQRYLGKWFGSLFSATGWLQKGVLTVTDVLWSKYCRWSLYVVIFFVSGKWLWSLVIILPAYLGMFARGERSFLPWETFFDSSQHFGLWIGSLEAIAVTVVDIWLFVGVAQWRLAELERQHEAAIEADFDHSQIVGHVTSNTRRLGTEFEVQRSLLPIINALAGLILVTSANPLYRLIDRL